MPNTDSIPPDFICPLTGDMMENPVVLLEDGHSYEKFALEQWLKKNKTSPQTKTKLKNPTFVINNDLKSRIEEYRLSRQILDSKSDFRSFNLRHGGPRGTSWENKLKLQIIISLLGPSGVGKSYLAHNAASIQISQEDRLPPNVSVNRYYFHLDRLFEEKYVVSVQINDCPGNDRFEAVTDRHFRNCHGAIFMFDSTDISTFQRLETYWYKQLCKKNIFDSFETVLACNKIDLLESYDASYRKTIFKQAEAFAARYQMNTINISALRGDNIHPMFHHLISNILQNPILLKDLKEKQTYIEVTSSNKNGKSSCPC